MITFTDLTMLMLAFFVLLYAMQTPISASLKADKTAESRSEVMLPEEPVRPPDAILNATALRQVSMGHAAYIAQIVERRLDSDARLADILLTRHGGNVRLTLSGEEIFNLDTAEIKDESIPVIVALAGILETLRNQIVVEVPATQLAQSPVTRRDITDWSLALSRAAAFSRAIRLSGYSSPLAVFATREQDIQPANASSHSKEHDSQSLSLVLKPYEHGAM